MRYPLILPGHRTRAARLVVHRQAQPVAGHIELHAGGSQTLADPEFHKIPVTFVPLPQAAGRPGRDGQAVPGQGVGGGQDAPLLALQVADCLFLLVQIGIVGLQPQLLHFSVVFFLPPVAHDGHDRAQQGHRYAEVQHRHRPADQKGHHHQYGDVCQRRDQHAAPADVGLSPDAGRILKLDGRFGDILLQAGRRVELAGIGILRGGSRPLRHLVHKIVLHPAPEGKGQIVPCQHHPAGADVQNIPAFQLRLTNEGPVQIGPVGAAHIPHRPAFGRAAQLQMPPRNLAAGDDDVTLAAAADLHRALAGKIDEPGVVRVPFHHHDRQPALLIQQQDLAALKASLVCAFAVELCRFGRFPLPAIPAAPQHEVLFAQPAVLHAHGILFAAAKSKFLCCAQFPFNQFRTAEDSEDRTHFSPPTLMLFLSVFQPFCFVFRKAIVFPVGRFVGSPFPQSAKRFLLLGKSGGQPHVAVTCFSGFARLG